jgi:hypothetical protein
MPIAKRSLSPICVPKQELGDEDGGCPTGIMTDNLFLGKVFIPTDKKVTLNKRRFEAKT